MKYIILLLFSSVTALIVAPLSSGQKEMTVPQITDSIRAIQSETVRLHAETARNLDSVQQINDYLKTILLSHDYRVYRYTNPRVKLVYKWQKGTPGHWELVRKLFY